MYSWYLDVVSEGWGGVISDNYSTVFPISSNTKLGLKQFNQALFTREFDIIGDKFSFEDIMPLLKKQFKRIHFRSSTQLNIDYVQRVHQFIELNESFSVNYSTNAKRLIKKSNKNYSYQVVNCIDDLIELVEVNVAHKIKEFTPENISKLKALMNSAFANGKGEAIAVYDKEEIVAAGFFLKDKKRITYLKGASTDEAKKNGAMFGLMNFAFSNYAENYSTFDFGGSNIESVANFYKKFGAKDKIYYEYTINTLPLWFKLLKKLKR